MLQKASLHLLGLAGCLLICGCDRSSARQPSESKRATPSAIASIAPKPIVSPPSTEASRYFIDLGPTWVEMRADLARLSKSELVPAILPFALQQADTLKPEHRVCLERLLEHSRDLLLSTTHGGGLAALALDDAGPAALRSACVGTLVSAARTQVRGSDEAYTVGQDQDVLALAPGNVLLYGSRAHVEAALDPTTKRAPLPAHFKLVGDDQLAVHFVLENMGMSFLVTTSTTPQRLLSVFSVDLPSEAEAEQLANNYQATLQQTRQLAGVEGVDQRAVALVSAFSVTRQAKTVTIRMEFKGPARSQAADLQALVETAIALNRSKSAPPPEHADKKAVRAVQVRK